MMRTTRCSTVGRNHFRGRKSNFSVSALKKSLRSGVINELLFVNSETRNSAVLLYFGCILWNICCKRYIYILDIWKPIASTRSSVLSWLAKNQLSSTLNSSNITARPTFLFSKTIFEKYIYFVNILFCHIGVMQEISWLLECLGREAGCSF